MTVFKNQNCRFRVLRVTSIVRNLLVVANRASVNHLHFVVRLMLTLLVLPVDQTNLRRGPAASRTVLKRNRCHGTRS